MRQTIPAPVISACVEVISRRENHSSLNNLFMHAGAPGDPPIGAKPAKCLEWLRRVNADEAVQPLQVLGKLIEMYMEEDLQKKTFLFGSGPEEVPTADQEKIQQALSRCDLQYARGGKITGTLGSPTRALEDFIRARDIPAVDLEFNRALANVELSPREAVSAASNILESICKVYIAERGLEMPNKQDLKPVWNVVRKDLGFDPGAIEDQDLQVILTGLFGVIDGIGALRTHASSAHGPGVKTYKLEPRHARLAIHSAHTAALFILESWEKRKK
ncbi:abortive infection family protein [Comamonas sp. lk]|uniref:abortive infection family protein n=1 Tax=Comamonas sp. lk TaxID=2201272 RepID=UPI000EB044CC|nr:abortive infection family protein [Comamonas sp. lk]